MNSLRKNRLWYYSEAVMLVALLSGMLLVAVSSAMLQAGEEVPVPESTIEQKFCPVMEGNPIVPNLFVDYQGKRVYFCCQVCVAAFQKEPEKYLAKLPQFNPELTRAGETAAAEASAAAGQHEDAEPQGHDSPPEAPRGLARVIRFLGQFHPVSVHVPIALVMITVLAEVLAAFGKAEFFRAAARFNIMIAAFGATLAMLLGMAAETSVNYAGEYAEYLEMHETSGIISTLLIVLCAFLSEISFRKDSARCRFAYRLLLALAAVMIILTSYFGGSLVYGIHHYTW